MYMIALRNKTVAHTFLPSLDNAEWPVSVKKGCRDPEMLPPRQLDVILLLSIMYHTIINNIIIYSKYFFDK